MATANSVRRFIDARDVAHVVAFLASPKSVAINGDAIAAGGGVGNAILLLTSQPAAPSERSETGMTSFGSPEIDRYVTEHTTDGAAVPGGPAARHQKSGWAARA